MQKMFFLVKTAILYQKYGKRKVEFSTFSTIVLVENRGIFYQKPRFY